MSLVSIVIPVYNHEKLVVECVESAKNQTYQNIEIILVNDFSTDHSAKVCTRLAETFDNVFFYEQPMNQGPLAARVRGIKESGGEFFVFCDADDMLPENCIESLVTGFKNMHSDMIMGNFSQKYEDKIVDNRGRLPIGIHQTKELLKEQIDNGSMSGLLISSQCGKLYQKKIVEKFIDELPLHVRINEDGVFNTYYLLNSNSVGVISDRVYMERSRIRNDKKQVNMDLFKPANEVLLSLREKWPDQGNFDQQMQRRAITTTFILSLWLCNHSSFPSARKQMKKLWTELEPLMKANTEAENNMRTYKRVFYQLMKRKMYLLFFIGIRISPLLRKHVAR